MPDTPTAVLDRLSPAQRGAVTRWGADRDLTPEQAVTALFERLAAVVAEIGARMRAFVAQLVDQLRAFAASVEHVHDVAPLWFHRRARLTFWSCPLCSTPEPSR